MSKVMSNVESRPLMLKVATAGDLMTDNPVSVGVDATVDEAIEMLARKGFSAAPVIDLSGRAVGVVSLADVMCHERERRSVPCLAPEDADMPGVMAAPTLVRDIMTPVVFSVTPDTSATEVVKLMLDWKVHHLFVIDDHNVLVGVISTLDVLAAIGR